MYMVFFIAEVLVCPEFPASHLCFFNTCSGDTNNKRILLFETYVIFFAKQ